MSPRGHRCPPDNPCGKIIARGVIDAIGINVEPTLGKH